MQEQINAIKQLLEINNITESQIDGILIKALGLQASWESCSTICELADFEDQFCEEEISNEIRWIMELLWRSRIDLNDAKHHAEIVGLDELLAKKDFTEIAFTAFAKSRLEALLETRNAEIENLKLALDAAKKPTDDLRMECDQLRRDLRERDREIIRLKECYELFAVALKNELGLESTRESAILEAIANLKADINMLKQSYEHNLTERDREIKELQNAIDVYQTNIQDHKKDIQELEITVKNHREQFDDLKSHFEVALKAIAMNLNALKGERKPDRIELVDGVETRYRDYINNLTHHQKTLIIEHMQLAIAEEAKKLKNTNIKDFSFDEIPF